MSDGARALLYAARPAVVAKYTGQLALVIAALTLVPLAAALVAGQSGLGARLATAVLVLTAAGAPLARLPPPAHLQTNEALSIVALTFVIAPLATLWALMHTGLGAMDAWFQAVSAVTTTGLSTLGTLDGRGPVFLFTRAWMQWYGGLGIAVLALALVVHHRASTRRLLGAEPGEGLAASTRTHARRLSAVYLVLSVAGLALLLALGMPLWDALAHLLAAVSTGGFSTHDGGLAVYSPGLRAAVIALALAGAVSLPLYYRLWRGDWRGVWRDSELRALILLCLGSSLVLAWVLGGHLRPGASLGQGLLLGISAQTTAGFSALEVASLPPAAKASLLVNMLIGGSLGSTAGGFKLVRLLILLRAVQLVLRRAALPPHAVVEAHLGGQRLADADLVRALLVVLLFVAVILVSWLPFVALGYDPLNALFEVVSATCTVGLSTGISAPDLPAPLKLLLTADMLLGRLEIIAMLVVLFPGTWFGRRAARA